MLRFSQEGKCHEHEAMALLCSLVCDTMKQTCGQCVTNGSVKANRIPYILQIYPDAIPVCLNIMLPSLVLHLDADVHR